MKKISVTCEKCKYNSQNHISIVGYKCLKTGIEFSTLVEMIKEAEKHCTEPEAKDDNDN